MHSNATNNTNVATKLIYPELSYVLTGLCFNVHNDLGRYARERQYGDCIAKLLVEKRIPFQRELAVFEDGNRVDFLVDDKIILELKAKRIITKDDYLQTQRYLQMMDIRLGLLVNFRSMYLKPMRVVKIEK